MPRNPMPAPSYNDDGDAMDVDARERVPTVTLYCGQPGTPLEALPCGFRPVQIVRARKYAYATYQGRRWRLRRTPALDAWLDKVGAG